MNISHTTIDQRLFDYFEGNLSKEEKGAVLNFIHQNPQYEREFALWAKTYVCLDNTPKEYGLSAALLQPEKVIFNFKPWIYGCVAVSALFYFSTASLESDKQQKTIDLQEKSEEKKPLIQPISSEIHLEKQLLLHKINKQESITRTTESSTVQSIQKEEIQLILEMENSVQAEAIRLESATSIEENAPENKPTEGLIVETPRNNIEETQKKNGLTQQSAKDSSKAEKGKANYKQLPLDLKPDEKFMPINSNF